MIFNKFGRVSPLLFRNKKKMMGIMGVVGTGMYIGNNDPERKYVYVYHQPYMFSSYFMGILTDVHIPYKIRKPIISLFAKFLGANLAETHSPSSFSTLGEFFSRGLHTKRTISKSLMVSPADGVVQTVKSISPLKESLSSDMLDIKGKKLSLKDLFQDPQWSCKNISKPIYYYVIYLSPKDYHRFHAPVKMDHISYKFITGLKYPVFPYLTRLFPQILSNNERYVMSGKWIHGKIGMVAVGALNVGKIIPLSKSEIWDMGDEAGAFSFGSTVVVAFEGPENLSLQITPGSVIQQGDVIIPDIG